MKPSDVDRAKHELQRLNELEGGLNVLNTTGRFEIRAIGKDRDRHTQAEFLSICTPGGYGYVVTPMGFADMQVMVRDAYEAEIAKTKERLSKLGIDLGASKEAKAA